MKEKIKTLVVAYLLIWITSEIIFIFAKGITWDAPIWYQAMRQITISILSAYGALSFINKWATFK